MAHSFPSQAISIFHKPREHYILGALSRHAKPIKRMSPYMYTLAHLSDIHLSPMPKLRRRELLSRRMFGFINWQRRKHFHQRDVLDLLTADLLAQNPDHIAVTGDITNLGATEEYKAALKWLEILGTPDHVTVTPGNHDTYVRSSWENGMNCWAAYMAPNAAGQRFSGSFRPTPILARFPFVRILADAVALVAVCSARPNPPTLASGRLGSAQLERLAAALAALGREGLCRVVLIHHPPLPGMTDWSRALHDAEDLAAVLRRFGAELVLHGHHHKHTITRLDAAGGPIPIVGAPSASAAHRVGRKPAARFNLYRIERAGKLWRIEMASRALHAENFAEESRPFPLFHQVDHLVLSEGETSAHQNVISAVPSQWGRPC
jgi:3',5'-cyclic AMP phosphodiesterase CpdA